MFYSAVFVRLRREGWTEALAQLRVQDGVVVHHQEPESGRLILTLEAPTVDAQSSLLGAIRQISGVLVAEPVYAYQDRGTETAEPPDATHFAAAPTEGALS